MRQKVELVEELSADEVQLSAFNTPYDNGDGLWTVSAVTTEMQMVEDTIPFG